MARTLAGEVVETGPNVDQVLMADESGCSTFAPVTKNRTYIGVSTKKFQDYLDTQSGNERWTIEEKYRLLECLNRGTHKTKGKTYSKIMRQTDDWYICNMVATQLEMKGWEKKAVWEMVGYQDKREFKKCDNDDSEPQRKIPLMTYCACIILHNEGQTDKKARYYPGKKLRGDPKWDGRGKQCEGLEDRHLLFPTVADDLEFTESDVRSCLERLRSRVKRHSSVKGDGPLSLELLDGSECWSEYINP